MSSLKIILSVIILFVLLVAGIYYYYQTQVSNVSDLNLNTQASPGLGFKEASPSASTKGTSASASQATTPGTGPEDRMALATTISITNPAQASTITSPVQVNGFANITSQVVEIQIKDSNGNTLGTSRASACLSYTACDFAANIVFAKPQTSTGTIEAFAKSTIDGSPVDITSLGVNFD